MTVRRLWGAASAYLMIGVLWSFLYAIVDRASPQSFAVRGSIAPLQLIDLLYFSFSTLTTTGYRRHRTAVAHGPNGVHASKGSSGSCSLRS